MKYLLLLNGLLASLAGCQQKDPNPTSPLLGHWQADTERLISYKNDGQIIRDTTVAHRREYDFTATTCTQVDYLAASVKASVPVRSTWNYGQKGDTIWFSPPSGYGNYSPFPALLILRSRTPTSFTLETDPHFFTIRPATNFIPFHR
jgi:hypothetical protein